MKLNLNSIGIEVDGEAVPQEDGFGRMNWTARSGSVIVELQPSYLATLPAGAHTIAALFDDGDPASADFKVSPAPAPATHTVTFDANGHGKAPDAQEVELLEGTRGRVAGGEIPGFEVP